MLDIEILYRSTRASNERKTKAGCVLLWTFFGKFKEDLINALIFDKDSTRKLILSSPNTEPNLYKFHGRVSKIKKARPNQVFRI